MVMEKQFEEILYSRYQARIRDMKILKVDEGFEQILGYSAEDVERLQLYVKYFVLGGHFSRKKEKCAGRSLLQI